MKKKSALALAMTGGLEVVMTPWAEVECVPSRKKEKRDSKPFRYVAVRLSRRQGELFGDGNGGAPFCYGE